MKYKEFSNLLNLAKNGDVCATTKLLEIFDPMLKKNSKINGKINDDLYQELRIKLINCVKKFELTQNTDICSIAEDIESGFEL